MSGEESPLLSGDWVPVVPATLAAVNAGLIYSGRHRAWPALARWVIAGVAAAAGSAMIVYCFLFWIDLTKLLMVPFGVPMNDTGLFLVRALGVFGGVLTLLAGREEFRRVWPGCDRCGRRHGRSPERRTERSPWWAYAGAYLAVAGLLARLAGGMPQLTGEPWTIDGPGGIGFKLFLAGMVLAGSVLPLALAHRWGRVWPRWVMPWAGRPVPRWLVLGRGCSWGSG